MESSIGIVAPPPGGNSFSVTTAVGQDGLQVKISALRARSETRILSLDAGAALEASITYAALGRTSAVEVYVAPSTTWREYRPEFGGQGGGVLELIFVALPARRDAGALRDGLAVARFTKTGEQWQAVSPFLPLVTAVGAEREVQQAVLDIAARAAGLRDRCHEHVLAQEKSALQAAGTGGRQALMAGDRVRILEPVKKKQREPYVRCLRSVAVAAHELSQRLRAPNLEVLTMLAEVDTFVGAARLLVGEPPRKGAAFTLDGQVDLTDLFQRARDLVTSAIARVEEELQAT